MMKKYILLILIFYMCSICFAQERINKNNIQICYGISSFGIGGQDHCVTIWFEYNLIFLSRVCYIFNDIPKYVGEYMSKYIDNETSLQEKSLKSIMLHKQSFQYAILRHYQNNDNYLILDERVEVNNSQLDEFIKIINEIKGFVSEVDANDEIIISTRGSNHYVITDKDGTTIIVDWLGDYNRSRDIERVLGLKSYLCCPCLE